MEWFGSVESIESLKAEYLNYLRKWKNDEETMKEINGQYEDLLVSLGVELNEKIEEQNKTLPVEYQKKKFVATDDRFKEMLNKVIDFNMNIEIIGQWIWCFDAKEYHEQLKELGFWFSASKKAWVYSGYKKWRVRSHNKIDEIRRKWGSEQVKEKEEIA